MYCFMPDRKTVAIQISDSSGTRDYEMFSGGEAFRVNFAIRLALSEGLAQRAGARLQTLVIDEGFGSQDIQGRQRLVERGRDGPNRLRGVTQDGDGGRDSPHGQRRLRVGCVSVPGR
jgi:ABC-type hemin transport system ATPase subunit